MYDPFVGTGMLLLCFVLLFCCFFILFFYLFRFLLLCLINVTGSLLLACAHFGAHVIGSDIDIRTLRNNSMFLCLFFFHFVLSSFSPLTFFLYLFT